MKDLNEYSHFKPIFWYICVTTLIVLAYVISVTYIPIPKGNERFADTSLGFLLGTFLGGGMLWLTGGSPTLSRKTAAPAATDKLEISATTTLETNEPEVK